MKENIIGAIAVVGILLSVFTLWSVQPHFPAKGLGAASGVTGMLAEQYIPYILYNNGFKTAKDIVQTTTDAATTTFAGGCIQTTATSTATPIKFIFNASGTSTTLNGLTPNGVVLWAYGNCP